MTPAGEKVSEGVSVGAVLAGWTSWVVSHQAAINGVLQTILLIVSIVATVLAARYHWKKTRSDT